MAKYSYFQAWGLEQLPKTTDEARDAAKRITCLRHGRQLVATPEVIDAVEGVTRVPDRDIPEVVNAHLEVIERCKEGLVGENARETTRLQCAITAFRKKYGFEPIAAVA